MSRSQPLRPMSVVLGGIPPIEDIVGREADTAAVLDAFRGHGALLTGDRRYGKTCLTRLVEAAAVSVGHHAVRISAERKSYEDFVDALADALAGCDSAVKQEIDRWRVSSITLGPVTAERAATAQRSLDVLIQAALRAHPDALLVLCIDEIPVLCRAMETREPGSGGDLLHLLRRLRQEHPARLVMVLSGSIGFHHVTRDALGAVNDVAKIRVGPLDEVDGVHLARCLLLGEQVATSDEAAVGRAIAVAAEGIPYYVQHLVKSARNLGAGRPEVVTPDDVPALVDAALVDPDDPWDLRHYRDRIPIYYGEDDAEVVSAILDCYALADQPLTVDDARRALGAAKLEVRPSRSRVVEFVELLEADHYLVRDGAGDRFASALVRRAWLAHRRR